MAGIVVVGVGPGLGQSIAARFAREGLPVTVIARHADTVTAAAEALASTGVPVLAVTADSTDEKALRGALDQAVEAHGVPDVVVYNAAIIQADAPGDLSADEQLDAYAVNVVGALTTASHLVPTMATAHGQGTYIITGGMPEPLPEVLSLSLGKAGVRALASMLQNFYGPRGIHVGTVTVGGAVAVGTPWDPDTVAEHYWRLHSQPRDEWELEVRV